MPKRAATKRSSVADTRLRAALLRLLSDDEAVRTELALATSASFLPRIDGELTSLRVALAELASAQARTEQRVADLAAALARLADRVGNLDGGVLELHFRDRAPAYFGKLVRRARVLTTADLDREIGDRLSDEDRADLLLVDLALTGSPVGAPDLAQVWIAAEVSSIVDRLDVERAVRRAALLRRLGHVVVPAVAGRQLTEGASERVPADGVLCLVDGVARGWELALDRARRAA